MNGGINMFKRSIAILSAAVIALGMAGCGESDQTKSSSRTDTGSTGLTTVSKSAATSSIKKNDEPEDVFITEINEKKVNLRIKYPREIKTTYNDSYSVVVLDSVTVEIKDEKTAEITVHGRVTENTYDGKTACYFEFNTYADDGRNIWRDMDVLKPVVAGEEITHTFRYSWIPSKYGKGKYHITISGMSVPANTRTAL